MAKRYTKKTKRSRRKLRHTGRDAVQIETADGQAVVALRLPVAELLQTRVILDRLAGDLGLLALQGLLEDEVIQKAGPRYAHGDQRAAYRWGQEDGYVVMAGRKTPIRRPRIRGVDGKEVPLERYDLFQQDGDLQRSVAQKIIGGISSRNYEGVLDDICDGYGVAKSSVSRQWKTASAAQLRTLLERPLGDLDLAVVMLDGTNFADYTVIVALGVDTTGRKHVLGLWTGSTENAVLCGTLLDELIERGLAVNQSMLFVLDGARALRKAVVDRFAERAIIQRCTVHKRRNVLAHLPQSYHRIVSMKLKAAWNMAQYDQARDALQEVVTYLRGVNPDAARSLEEASEQTLTVHKLGLGELLRTSLRSTNIIENCLSTTKHRCRQVKYWSSPDMATRWAGTMLLESQKHFHRLRGYRQMPVLLAALGRPVEKSQEIV